MQFNQWTFFSFASAGSSDFQAERTGSNLACPIFSPFFPKLFLLQTDARKVFQIVFKR